MRKPDLDAMQIDELWQIHKELTKILSDRMLAEKRELEKRLAKLNRIAIVSEPRSSNSLSKAARAPRRKCPNVLPQSRNPLAPSERCSRPGKQPRWIVPPLLIGRSPD